jgi:hypothetical protein
VYFACRLGEVELSGNAALEKIQVFGAAHARDDQVQAVDDVRMDRAIL